MRSHSDGIKMNSGREQGRALRLKTDSRAISTLDQEKYDKAGSILIF